MATVERITLQVPIPLKTLAVLDQAASLSNNSQTYIGSWAIEVGLDNPSDIGSWITKAIKHGIQEKPSHSEDTSETRVKIQLKKEVYYNLLKAADAIGISHLKLAAILIRVVLASTPLAQMFLATSFCAAIKTFMNGKTDWYFECYDKPIKQMEEKQHTERIMRSDDKNAA